MPHAQQPVITLIRIKIIIIIIITTTTTLIIIITIIIIISYNSNNINNNILEIFGRNHNYSFEPQIIILKSKILLKFLPFISIQNVVSPGESEHRVEIMQMLPLLTYHS